MTAAVVLILDGWTLLGLTIAGGCFGVAGWQARRAHDWYRRRHGHRFRWRPEGEAFPWW